MNKWKIWYGESECHTLEAMTINEVIKLARIQNWNQDNVFITKIELL